MTDYDNSTLEEIWQYEMGMLVLGFSCFSYSNKAIYYLKDNLYHRQNGPAIIRSDGWLTWYFNGKKHRENGPAEYLIGDSFFSSWFINGCRIDKEVFINNNEVIILNKERN
ncbi:MAG: hypothetical protein ACOCV1_03110 [Bacillota bacterium]